MIFSRGTAPRRRVPPATRRHRLVGLPLTALVIAGSAVVGAPAAAAAPNTDPYEPPSVTVQAPVTDDCAQRDRPPPAVDTSEDVPPGASPPASLPVPANPVGGAQLGECGLIVPAGAPPPPSDISAGAWVVADMDTGSVLAAKDPHGRYRPASTLKLLTVLPLLKNLKRLDQIVLGTDNDTAQEGTRVGIEPGGKYTIRQLLTYLIIRSGNDAANALARANGGYDETIADMNATAKALGALDTRAATVSGLDGPGQTTSAYDLALFAKAAMAITPFPDIVSSIDVRVPASDGEGYIAANDNQLLYQYPGALGGKTGFTDDAAHTYLGMAERDGRRLVVTMLNGSHEPRRQWMQAASLLDWGFALPASTPPVGQLVGSLAEATAVSAQPTASTGASASSGASSELAAGASALASDGTAVAGDDVATSGMNSNAANSSATDSTAADSGGVPTALILAGIGVLIVAIGIGLLLRRRHLNKKPTSAGDAQPADGHVEPTEPGTPGTPEPAEASTDETPEAEPSATEPSATDQTDAPAPSAEPDATPPAPSAPQKS